MHHPTHRAPLASGVFICVLVLMISATAAHGLATTAQPTTILHFQTTSAPRNNATVTNVLTVRSQGISLCSTIEAQGRVTSGTPPLANAQVALHMGDVIVATTQTDASGAYSFSAPVGVYYFSAALSGGATVY